MGVATLEQGRIEFQPAVYDTLEPSGRAQPSRDLKHYPFRGGSAGRTQNM